MTTNKEFVLEDVKVEQNHHSIWAEKYRPRSLNEYIGNDTVKGTVKIFLEKGDIPHLLLFGPAGTGKTSLGKLVTHNIICDHIYINASDENSVDNVRNKIKGFASTVGFKPLKVVFLDEGDRLTPEAQCALRNMMETYSGHTRFIITCNYHEKMIEPIVSRCQAFEIKPPSKKDVAIHLSKILQAEKVTFKPEDIGFIVNSYFPDIRKIINFTQQSNVNGELKIATENAVESDFRSKLVELLKTPSKQGVFTEIRQLVANAAFSSYDEVYKHLFNKVDEFAKGKEAVVILELADGVYQSSMVFEKEITFVAIMFKILRILNK